MVGRTGILQGGNTKFDRDRWMERNCARSYFFHYTWFGPKLGMIRLSRLSAEKATGTRTLNLHRGCFNPKLQASQRTVTAETKTNQNHSRKKRNGNAFGMYAHGSVSIVTHFFARTLVCAQGLEKPSASVFASSISPIRKRPELNSFRCPTRNAA